MKSDSVLEYQKVMIKANQYHKKALWQEKLRLLQEALALCDEPDFPEADARRQELLYGLGGIRRRLGQYDQAEQMLQQSLQAFPTASPLKRASILGELGVVFINSNRFSEAREATREQYALARDAAPSLEAEVELCRAVGNEGMAAYLISQQKQPYDAALLDTASAQIWERIERAQNLQRRLRTEDLKSNYVAMARAWETIGLDRLTLCYIAAGKTAEAVEIAEKSQQRQTHIDPTVTALSKFFYGKALWSNGRRDEALRQWNAPPGTCSSPMAFCKEPAAEHTEYVRLMASAGVNLDMYDEQGFTALDYAVLSDNSDAKDMIPIIVNALRLGLRRDINHEFPGLTNQEVEEKLNEEILIRERQAELRRQYRTILQEHIRPELRIKNSNSLKKLRILYANFLSQDPKTRSMFSRFNYVKFTEFTRHGKLPIYNAGLTDQFADDAGGTAPEDEDIFILFFSYRWLGRNVPDDDNGTQWNRMMSAIQGFLKINHHVQPERLGLWLVSNAPIMAGFQGQHIILLGLRLH